MLGASASLEPDDVNSRRYLTEFFGADWGSDQIIPGSQEPVAVVPAGSLPTDPFVHLAKAAALGEGDLAAACETTISLQAFSRTEGQSQNELSAGLSNAAPRDERWRRVPTRLGRGPWLSGHSPPASSETVRVGPSHAKLLEAYCVRGHLSALRQLRAFHHSECIGSSAISKVSGPVRGLAVAVFQRSKMGGARPATSLSIRESCAKTTQTAIESLSFWTVNNVVPRSLAVVGWSFQWVRVGNYSPQIPTSKASRIARPLGSLIAVGSLSLRCFGPPAVLSSTQTQHRGGSRS